METFIHFLLLNASLFLTAKTVGCDGIVNSGKVFDQCGVCGGNNTSCKIMSGIFTRRHLSTGRYNFLTRIPRGTCNINITELRRSRNYIALKIRGGGYILNGNWRIQPTGDYKAAGTTFTYDRVTDLCPGGCVSAEGPTNATIEVELLYYGINHGIHYRFAAPKSMFRDEAVNSLFSNSVRRKAPYYDQSIGRGHPQNHVNKNRRHHHRHNRQRHHRRRKSHLPNGYSKGGNDGQTQNKVLKLSGSERSRNSNPYPESHNPSLQETFERTSVRRFPTAHRETDSTAGHGSRRHFSSDATELQVDRRPSQDSHQRFPIRLQDRKESPVSRRGNQIANRDNTDGFPYNDGKDKAYFATSNGLNSVLPPGDFKWKIIGFGQCSQSCGGGVQETEVICVTGNSRVTDDNCDLQTKPKAQAVVCNTGTCKPDWYTGNWSECSATCGRGYQTRHVECKHKISSAVQISVSANKCLYKPRPHRRRDCKRKSCTDWKTGDWTKCSVTCGHGEKVRRVQCSNATGHAISESHCKEVKPKGKEFCDMGYCAKGWFHTKWSSQCTTECGQGSHLRNVYCAAGDGTPVPEEKCSRDERPREQKPCRENKPCGGIWFRGPWSQCSASCGNATSYRDVVCIKRLSTTKLMVADEENCVAAEKPLSTKSCLHLDPCPVEWFMTPWSECSVSCGGGYKSRDVKCVDHSFSPSAHCSSEDKPAHRRHCNTSSCKTVQSDSAKDSNCQDYSEKTCEIVYRARLCRYAYYKNKCCHSCKRHHPHRKQ